MSPQFLVSKGQSSCLWGAFLSDPGLTETQANSGILALSYGTPPAVPDGGTQAYCPELGFAPTGDALPDDLTPGDVLDLTGRTNAFVPSSCTNTVAQIQLSNVSSATRTATGAALPTPHALSASELLQLNSPTDQTFHNQWGGVKVRVVSVVSQPQQDGGAFTDTYGNAYVNSSSVTNPTAADTLLVGDKLYYRGYEAGSNFCYAGPVYANAATSFTSIDGFSYLAFCTWALEPANKCADLTPPSDDCGGSATACP